MPEGNGRPQPWDPEKVRAAVGQFQRLVVALGADETGNAYRSELEIVVDEALGEPDSSEFRDRLAMFLYGSALFGLGALSAVEATAKLPRERVLALLEENLKQWLDSTGI